MRTAFALLFLLPATMAEARVSSGFGARVDPIDGRRAMHRGLDIPAPHGAAVRAAAAGVVRAAGWRGGYGLLVEIAHRDGAVTRYGHLSAIHVRAGQPVAQGEVIARIGSTGRATGDHLHFEYRLVGEAVDPTPYFGAAPPPAAAPRQSRPEPAHRSAFARGRAAVAGQGGLPDGADVARGAVR
jgi:murein DD-endopeptidase MepM/ murein hydrolase activator NlpD